MPASLADRLAALDRERAAFLDALDRLAPEARTARPAPGTWSPLEIGEHTFRAERAVLRGLEKQLDAGDARVDVGAHNPAGIVLLLAAMRAPKKLRIPEGARGVAPEGMDYAALRAEWGGLGARWAGAVGAFPATLEKTPLLRHPITGALTLGEALRFLTAHASRHRRQLAHAARPAGIPNP